MRTFLDPPLVLLMAHPTFYAQFGSDRRSEGQIVKMTLDQWTGDRKIIAGLIRQRLTNLCGLRLYRIKCGAATYLLHILMCVGLTILPSQSSLIADVVEGGTITGKLTGPSGEVVVAAHVTATIQNPSTPSSGKLFEAYSNEAGIFTLTNLPAGTYDVTVGAFGFKSQTIDSVLVAESKTTNLTISLESRIYRACGNTKGSSYALEEEDKAEIVRQILERVFVVKDLPGPRFLLDERKQIVLSTEQIRPGWVSNHAQIEFLLLDGQQITEMASKTGDFQYLHFSSFKTNGPCVAVTLTREWAVSENSDQIYFGGGGYIYEFHKVGDKWVGKYAGGWVS